MIPIGEFMAQLEAREIRLRLDGDRIRISAPHRALNDSLRSELALRKPEILRFLERPPARVVFDPSDPGLLEDPYPTYAVLREREPVHRSPMGAWALTRYDDIVAALNDDRLVNSPAPYAVVNERNKHRYISADVANNILPFIDPPRHTRLRSVISQAFRSQVRDHPPNIRGIADRLLDAHRSAGEIDIINGFGKPLSVAVFSEMLGVPDADRRQLERWSELFFYLFVPIPSAEILGEIEKALYDFRAYFLARIDELRGSPGEDLISLLIRAGGGPDGLSEKELADTCMLLFADGIENIDSAIGNGLIALLENPEQLAKLEARPELMPLAVDECLRFDPPSQFIARIATEDIVVRDVEIRKGDAIFLVLAAANRDPERFEDPDELDITREANQHVSFGRGRHFCIGAQVVRLHVEVGLRSILKRLPDLKRKQGPIRRVERPGHRWLESLPVTFSPY